MQCIVLGIAEINLVCMVLTFCGVRQWANTLSNGRRGGFPVSVSKFSIACVCLLLCVLLILDCKLAALQKYEILVIVVSDLSTRWRM